MSIIFWLACVNFYVASTIILFKNKSILQKVFFWIFHFFYSSSKMIKKQLNEEMDRLNWGREGGMHIKYIKRELDEE